MTDAAVDWLAEHGYEPEYGARPLRRLIQRELDDRIADLLVAEAVADGSRIPCDRRRGRTPRDGRQHGRLRIAGPAPGSAQPEGGALPWTIWSMECPALGVVHRLWRVGVDATNRVRQMGGEALEDQVQPEVELIAKIVAGLQNVLHRKLAQECG